MIDDRRRKKKGTLGNKKKWGKSEGLGVVVISVRWMKAEKGIHSQLNHAGPWGVE